jgi:small subunit ribosomal protein S13
MTLTNIKKTLLKNLTTIYGIGKSKAISFHKIIGLNTRKNPSLLKQKQVGKLNKIKASVETSKKLITSIKNSIVFSQKIKTYRGIRNKLNYPCRGQRTHTNAKTKKKIKI